MKAILKLITVMSSVSLILVATQGQAKQREQTTEASFIIGFNDSFTIDGQQGSSVDFDSDYSIGFNIIYNYSSQFAVEFDWLTGRQDYLSNLVDDEGEVVDTVDHTASITHAQLHGTYYFSPENFSFYLQGGAGFSYIDSNIISGPPINICWWDPWFGYICEGFSATYSKSEFSYSASVGARYNLDNTTFIRASYSQIWVDLDHAKTSDMSVYKFEIGRSF
ncbi:outer membrane beta-barrel protein [Thalassotalea sp. LPB0316]|uniref:outer membrane beta-barrel protein n=1 Tax=Thalassotalea sp. LPB0316 TaxID=2769490 RepID=UPI00186740AA|nr:outer membrane beta-barrel protein [Thalassotalea sp. LPB0316]QOL24958.1 outer membrane beta-barrel protein [Thalassotalea sp. LPB0316]